MSDQPSARVERDGPLATIVIDHPPLNLFGPPLIGVREADRRTAENAGSLFGTHDLRDAVKSFLSEGPGKARFAGK